MYFKLPIEQQQRQPPSDGQSNSELQNHPTVPTPNMSNIDDESWAAILANLNDHKASPPLVTPNTLSQLLNLRLDSQLYGSSPIQSSSTQTQETSPRPKYAELIQNIKQLAEMLSGCGIGDEMQKAIDGDEGISEYLSSTTTHAQSEDAALERLSSIIADFTNTLSKRPAAKIERNSDSRKITTNIAALITTPPVNKTNDRSNHQLVDIPQENTFSPAESVNIITPNQPIQ